MILFLVWLWSLQFMGMAVPTLVIAASVVGAVSVPVVYTRALQSVFGRKRAVGPSSGGADDDLDLWDLPFLGVFVLQFLLLADVLLILVGFLEVGVSWVASVDGMAPEDAPAWLGSSFVGFLGEVAGTVVHLAPGNAALWELLDWLLGSGGAEAAPFRAGWFSFAVKSALVVPFLLLARGLVPRASAKGRTAAKPTGPSAAEPAQLSYFREEAWRDVSQVCEKVARWYWNGLKKLVAIVVGFGWLTAVAFPLTFGLGLATLIALLAASVYTLVSVAVLALSIGLAWVVAMMFAFAFHWSERAVQRLRFGDAKCPHSGCYKAVPLPVFGCPNPKCGAKHRQLIPGRWGVFVRICECGKGRLPTVFGRSGLKSECPHCEESMHEELFRGGVHVAIYGGPSTGKTSYMTASVWSLLERHEGGVEAGLVDGDAKTWKGDFESGKAPDKTRNPAPDAFLVSVKREKGTEGSVYLYDPAGEALRDQTGMVDHGFLKHTDDFIFLVDPLTLGEFKGEAKQKGTSEADPRQTYEVMTNQLTELGGIRVGKRSSKRLAVVLTKADQGLEKKLRLSSPDPAGSENWSKRGTKRSDKIRKWLGKNQKDRWLVYDVERMFNTRYFAVSALGRNPDGTGSGFSPKGVTDPLMWLLSARPRLSRPLASRVAGLALAGAVRTAVATAAAALWVFPAAWAVAYFAPPAVQIVFGQPSYGLASGPVGGVALADAEEESEGERSTDGDSPSAGLEAAPANSRSPAARRASVAEAPARRSRSTARRPVSSVDYAEMGLRQLRALAEGGDPAAQFWLGFRYVRGLGVPADGTTGVIWLRRSAAQANVNARFSLGMFHSSVVTYGAEGDDWGETVAKNDEAAVRWLRLAAEGGELGGVRQELLLMRALGAHYEFGKGVPRDLQEAMKWYERAAEQGDVEARTRLGSVRALVARERPLSGAVGVAANRGRRTLPVVVRRNGGAAGNSEWAEPPGARAPSELPAREPEPAGPTGFEALDANRREIVSTVDFVLVPAGEFRMGTPRLRGGERDERPVTMVGISRPFEMSRYEVTQELWEAVMRSNPSWWVTCGATCPVESVSWSQVQQFIARVNELRPGAAWRLPTEAEWEYAARAGTAGNRYGELEAVAWCEGPVRPVGGRQANAYGLYDMLGNAAEWVQDWYGDYPGGAATDPTGPANGERRVSRGGSASLADASACRAGARAPYEPNEQAGHLGFRLARDVAGRR